MAAWSSKAFEYGTWGGEVRDEFRPQPGDVVALEHWCSSGFANTDLDLQLKKHGIHKLIVIGLIARAAFSAEHPATFSWHFPGSLPALSALIGAIVAPVLYVRSRTRSSTN